jgi:ABC-type branched-subunit amino acid transport system ATPase component
MAIVECTGVTKAYGGLLAVDDLSFSVETGEVFAIVGPNGAGKTTLFDTISGIARATEGAIAFDGERIEHLPPHEICRRGLARTFQTTVTFASQTVLENALVGAIFGRRGSSPLRFGADAVTRALDALALCGLLRKQAEPAATLPILDRKRLMLATALATQPKLLLLDEPVGGLNAGERAEMVALIGRVNAAGATVLMIEHVMKAVQALAGRMLVLHHGRKIAEGPPGQVLRNERVVEVYLGGAGAGLATVGAEAGG